MNKSESEYNIYAYSSSKNLGRGVGEFNNPVSFQRRRARAYVIVKARYTTRMSPHVGASCEHNIVRKRAAGVVRAYRGLLARITHSPPARVNGSGYTHSLGSRPIYISRSIARAHSHCAIVARLRVPLIQLRYFLQFQFFIDRICMRGPLFCCIYIPLMWGTLRKSGNNLYVI